jgi:hypothetical protein
VKHLQPEQIRDYALRHGWRIGEEDADRWLLHNGENDAEGQPLALIIPKTITAGTQRLLLKCALEVLGGQQGLPGYDIAIEIARLHDPVRVAAHRLVNLARRVPAGELDPFDDCYVITEHQFNPLRTALDGAQDNGSLNGCVEQ